MRTLLFILLFTLFGSTLAFATHTVGGDFSYVWLGNSQYQITFHLYRDCLNGNPNALQQDDPAEFRIFNMDNINGTLNAFSDHSIASQVVPPNFNNDCLTNPPKTCLSELTFVFVQTLAPNAKGYTVTYQRCCRNSAENMNNPQGNNIGSTFFTTINTSLKNSSPVFKNYPPQIICINNPILYDNSATDADGDSLTYSFIDAKDSPSDSTVPSGSQITPPPYPTIQYVSPYTALNPMRGSPTIKIDPASGLISGTPNVLGRFVVTVVCKEWRNGVEIGETRRDFQFNVTNCSKAVVANTPLFSVEPNTYIVQCKSNTVHFFNTSTGGFTYAWDFGVPGISSDTSILFEPTYTYTDTGTYTITLWVNKGTTCPDSITRIVKVYPNFVADYIWSGLLCKDAIINFTDKSTSTLAPAINWLWDFKDGDTSYVQNPTHAFVANGGTFNVTLISGNKYGCLDSSSKSFVIPPLHIKTGDDTVVLKNTIIPMTVTGGATYVWSPNQYIDNIFSSSPNFVFTDTGKYTYIVQGTTKDGCIGYDTIVFYVANDPYMVLPNAFSPNGDGVNDVINIMAAGFKKLDYFRIYDRWGRELFYTIYPKSAWDGTFNNKKCDMGTYFWQAQGKDIYGKTITLKGDITLVR